MPRSNTSMLLVLVLVLTFGPASRTVTGTERPLSSKMRVIPIFRHRSSIATIHSDRIVREVAPQSGSGRKSAADAAL